jgi:aspartyl-tRNA(Asn)/glutamyl-tRNA(Gln) amidotransferase subunit B
MTSRFDAERGVVVPMRPKVAELEYRYLPDTDLGDLIVSPSMVESARGSLPELPRARRQRLIARYGLTPAQALPIGADRHLSGFFEALMEGGAGSREAGSWVAGEVLADMKAAGRIRVSSGALNELIGLVRTGTLSGLAAKTVYRRMADWGETAEIAMDRLGVRQVGDRAVVECWVREVLASHEPEVARYRRGETNLATFFVGQVMKSSGGRADPRKAREIVLEQLAR